MAEIRCPMCGKPNPENLEICQYCQARLKPLIASTPSDSIIPDQSDSDSELPDWFETDADSNFDELEDDTPFGDEANDWMNRLGGDSESEEQPALQDKPDPEAERQAASRMDFDNNGIPDWLDDMEADRATPPLDDSQESSKAEPSSWFFDDEESTPSESLEENGDFPDWLSGLGDQEDDVLEEDLPAPASVSPFADTGDLFGGITSGGKDEISTTAGTEDDLPDWLIDMGREETPSSEESIPQQDSRAVTADDNELPDWLTSDVGSETPSDIPSDAGNLVDDDSGYIGQETIPIQDYVSSEEAKPSIGAEDAELPDWLSQEPEEEIESPASATEGDLPEWLSGMESIEAAPMDDETPSPGTEDAALPNWLVDLSEQEAAQAKEAPKPQKPFDLDTGILAGLLAEESDALESIPADDSDLSDQQPDLASQLSPVADDVSQIEASPSIGEIDDDGLPDWLSGEEASDPDDLPSVAPDESSDLPAWLADFDESEDEATPVEETAQPQAADPQLETDGDLPEWLSDGSADEVESASTTPAGDQEDLPAWLADYDEPEDEIAPVEETAQPQLEDSPLGADGDLPDWLSDGSADEVESATPAGDQEDLPAWLADFDESEDEAAPEEEIAQQQLEDSPLAADGDLPDWLSDGSADEPEGAPTAADQEDLPAWLADKAGDIALAAGIAKVVGDEVKDTNLGAAEIEVPGWLSDMDGEDGDAVPSIEENLPDWLSDIEGIEEIPESEEDLPRSAVDESRAVPNWLRDSEVSLPAVDDEVVAEPTEAHPFEADDDIEDDLFEMDQLADWISDESQSEIDQPQEKTGPADGLEPAELPGWLAAMRPVETAMPDGTGLEKSGPVENSGPLAGLQGVLAAEPDIARLKKPPVYSSKLQITDAQQSHATVLQELLEAESQPQALPVAPLLSSQRVFRVVLSAVLLVIAFIAVFAGSEIAMMPTPGNIPAGVDETRNLVNSLTADDTALIAFDYEPGLSGEMEAASAAVVDHMMLKGAKLVLLSTSPTGPALAERFVSSVQGTHGYVSGNQYVNLGYVPGGVTGLGAFAQNPRWVFPDTLNGEPAWDTAPLQNITGVSDFSLVVLITDNPNTARAWVEQVNPELGAVPMVALISAQAEPMVRPYFNNQQNQIDGIVSGLTGGAAYEVMTRPNVARTYWDAFNMVLIVAVSAIIIGGFITVISSLLAQRKESEGESG